MEKYKIRPTILDGRLAYGVSRREKVVSKYGFLSRPKEYKYEFVPVFNTDAEPLERHTQFGVKNVYQPIIFLSKKDAEEYVKLMNDQYDNH